MAEYTYRHVAGHSAYDHYAEEVINCARTIYPTSRTRATMEQAVMLAWRAVQPHPAIGPRIDVVREEPR